VATTIVETVWTFPAPHECLINRADASPRRTLTNCVVREAVLTPRSYAYLLVPADNFAPPTIARKRLAAIKNSRHRPGFESPHRPRNFCVAVNMRGRQAWPHRTIGFDMYFQMLERAVFQIEGEEVSSRPPTTLSLGLTFESRRTTSPRKSSAAHLQSHLLDCLPKPTSRRFERNSNTASAVPSSLKTF